MDQLRYTEIADVKRLGSSFHFNRDRVNPVTKTGHWVSQDGVDHRAKFYIALD